MHWQDFRRSSNVEDRRGDEPSFGPGGFGAGAGGLGIGTIAVLVLLGWAFGIDPSVLIGGAEMLSGDAPSYESPPSTPARSGAPTDQMGQFVAAVLGDTEDRWQDVFQNLGKSYRPPKLVMFS